MTSLGRAHCLICLRAAASLADLAQAWDTFDIDAKRDPEVLAEKDRLKAVLRRRAA